jgi:hypothetical protein
MAKRELIEPQPGANVQGERLLHLSRAVRLTGRDREHPFPLGI